MNHARRKWVFLPERLPLPFVVMNHGRRKWVFLNCPHPFNNILITCGISLFINGTQVLKDTSWWFTKSQLLLIISELFIEVWGNNIEFVSDSYASFTRCKNLLCKTYFNILGVNPVSIRRKTFLWQQESLRPMSYAEFEQPILPNILALVLTLFNRVLISLLLPKDLWIYDS